MLAVDFFHVDCAITLKRIHVFFAREIRSRALPPDSGHGVVD